VYVILHWPIDIDGIWVNKKLRFAICTNEAGKDSIPWLDMYWTAVVIDGRFYGAQPVRAKGPIESDALHRIMKELVVGFGAVGLCPF